MSFDTVVAEIDQELSTARERVSRLESAREALAAVDGQETSTPAPGKPKATRGRPKGGGTRSAEAVALVTKQPGITIPDMANQMGIEPNYLYRVLPKLASDGQVKRDGAGWHPAS